jgi:hypothetical protein
MVKIECPKLIRYGRLVRKSPRFTAVPRRQKPTFVLLGAVVGRDGVRRGLAIVADLHSQESATVA